MVKVESLGTLYGGPGTWRVYEYPSNKAPPICHKFADRGEAKEFIRTGKRFSEAAIEMVVGIKANFLSLASTCEDAALISQSVRNCDFILKKLKEG